VIRLEETDLLHFLCGKLGARVDVEECHFAG
jgi:hypothetical protein